MHECYFPVIALVSTTMSLVCHDIDINIYGPNQYITALNLTLLILVHAQAHAHRPKFPAQPYFPDFRVYSNLGGNKEEGEDNCKRKERRAHMVCSYYTILR